MGVALLCCLLGQAGGQEGLPPTLGAGCWVLCAVARTTETRDHEAFPPRTFTASLQRTGVLELGRPVSKVIIRALWAVPRCWLATIPRQVQVHVC